MELAYTTKTLNFCTLFDSNFMIQGLAMYRSLETHCADFCLYIFCFDDITLRKLSVLNLPNAKLISLQEFEKEPLLSVKSTRSRKEYCWTSTPFTILHCLNEYNLDSCTYLDADLLFFNDPKVLIDEIPRNKSVLLTEHRFSKKYAIYSKNAGIFNVQFMYFKNNLGGLKVLRWWIDRCTEWCYAYFENGKFGDQLYLNDWPTRFSEHVHVLQNQGGGLAPWNEQKYRFYKRDDNYFAQAKSTKIIDKIIFYHFHSVKLNNFKISNAHHFFISKKNYNIVYNTYITFLNNASKELYNTPPKIVLTYFMLYYPAIVHDITRTCNFIIYKTLKIILFVMKLCGVHPIYKKIKSSIVKQADKKN